MLYTIYTRKQDKEWRGAEDTNGCTERCLNLDGLGKVFWGYFLILLDFRVNGLDILPDFVGYFLIIAGLAGLSAESVWFGKAKPFAWISLLLSLSRHLSGYLSCWFCPDLDLAV